MSTLMSAAQESRNQASVGVTQTPPVMSSATRLTQSRPPSEATTWVNIADLHTADSPRIGGVDHRHIELLAQLDETLPPILVRHADMCIIDGAHRVAAARLRGAEQIEARLFYGSSEESFCLAVQQNIANGLPLTIADRQVAAERIILANPEYSDRFLAKTTGLASNTVAAIRRRALGAAQESVRIGRDGRVRPLSTAEGRSAASRAIAEHPEASLRAIARIAGVSTGTVRDVRNRLQNGQDPIPPQQRRHRRTGSSTGTTVSLQPQADTVDIDSLLDGLRCDPSLRYTDSGREFLRWLGRRIPRECGVGDLSSDIPPHSGVVVAKIARECSRIWLEVAEKMERLSGESA